ncbi:MAG: VTT domain-containing protein [Nanoarchaeota archaeon]|nr:VTT domain-containing protein [Nanoarchaeota archaeon]
MRQTIGNIRNHKIIQGLHFYSFGLLKRLYLWVLTWAESKHSTTALAILAFIESSFFPIPPDVLQIALSVAKPKRSFYYAFISSIFSVLGGIFGYYIGYFLFETVGKVIIAGLGYQDYFIMVGDLFTENAFLAILAAAFTPIPYKVFTIAAGVWKISLPVLILASVIGRPTRFFLVAAFTYFMGERVKAFLERYFNWISVILFLVILLGYIAIKYLI